MDDFSAEPAESVQARRLTRVFWAMEIGFCVAIVLNLYLGHIASAAVICFCAVGLVSVYWKIKSNLTVEAANSIVLIATLAVTGLVWMGRGLADEAMMAYPGILIYAVLTGSRHMFLGLLAFITTSILALGVADELQLLHYTPNPGGIEVAVTSLIVFAVIAYAVYLLSEDMQTASQNLSLENRRFRDSQLALEHLAHHDVLANLPNRTLARDRFDQAYSLALRDKREVAVLYLDLDHFKNINDSQGHQVGDKVLVEIASRLSHTLRESDTVCRLGGDEFLILISDSSADTNLTNVAQKVLNMINQPVALEGANFTCPAPWASPWRRMTVTISTPFSRKLTSPCTRPRIGGAAGFAFSTRAWIKTWPSSCSW